MTELTRRDVLSGTATAATGLGAVAGLSGTAAAHVAVDVPVVTTVNLSVREQPTTSATRLAVADQGTGGHVIDGPVTSDGFTWWRVSWNQDGDNGAVTGWSAEGDGWITGPTDFSYPCWGTVSQGFHSDHAAVDIANDAGTPLFAARSGNADASFGSRCGNFVFIDHGDGWRTTYCHMDETFVSGGQFVEEGQQIGTVGSTGNSTGPHVHFKIELNGANQFVPGFVGQDIVGGSGIPENYL